MLNITVLFFVLLAVWIILSGLFNITYLTFGFFGAAIAAGIYHLIYKEKMPNALRTFIRLSSYFLWLIREIAKSSLDVSLKMWKLDPEISPKVEWLNVDLRDDISMTIYANSVTLTPGSVTIGTGDGVVYIHCLTEKYMEEQKHQKMLQKVNKLTKTGKK